MEFFIDFPGKINEKFQVFKSKSNKKIRFGGPTTSKRLEDERKRRKEDGEERKGMEEGRWGKKEEKMNKNIYTKCSLCLFLILSP